MIQCYKEHTDAQMQVMKDAADKLIDDHLIPTGRVPYEAVVAAGILPGKTSENRDLFCPMRQFPHMFTHQDSVDRLAEYRRVHSAEYIEAQRVAKAQENGLTKELKQAETVLSAPSQTLRYFYDYRCPPRHARRPMRRLYR